MIKKLINLADLKALSFPDSEVISVKLDRENKILIITMDYAHLQPDISYNKGGSLTISNWKEINFRIYDINNKYTEKHEPLKSISEFIISDEGLLLLKGFTEKSLWCEYIINSPETVYFAS